MKNSTCYKLSNYNLQITNVEEKHAGVYTVNLANEKHHLYRNLTYTLVVLVKPTILELELGTVDVQPYMPGKQHQLTCTTYGVPMPKVTWLWQPCHTDPTHTHCLLHTKPIPVQTDDKEGYPHNLIESINTKIELVKGKNKVCGLILCILNA